MISREKQDALVSILEEELILATGCTEPIAIAYCAAKVRETLGEMPERVMAEVSGNIIKNAKSVVVPDTGGLKGIGAAVAAGIVAGEPEKKLQVISAINPDKVKLIGEFIKNTPISVVCLESGIPLDIRITAYAGENTAVVRISNNHINVVYIEKNGNVLKAEKTSVNSEENLTDKSVLNIKDIVEFADTADIERLRPLISRQIDCNFAIAKEGLENSWGANIGRVLLDGAKDIKTVARAYAAAGSDARMNGCEMPVVIVSGSGNQGITASVPIICYAKELGVSEEKMYRAIILSNLVTIHQKTGIGRLSAYCGSVSAGCGAGAGIAYLRGASAEEISQTINNAVVILSGVICDGAKASCAAKIACSVEAGIMGYEMVRKRQLFPDGDGIASEDVEKTIRNVGILASEGMKQTDKTILSIMTA